MLYLLNPITFGISSSTNLVQPLKAESFIVDTMGSLHEINSCLHKNAFSGTVIAFGKQTCIITFEFGIEPKDADSYPSATFFTILQLEKQSADTDLNFHIH